MKKVFKPFIAVLSLFLIYKLKILDTNQILSALQQPIIVYAGISFFLLHTLIFAIRWNFIVNLIQHTNLKNSIKETFIGNFFNFFIPSGVGGDVVKAIQLTTHTQLSKKTAFSLVLVDRIIGLFSLILFSFLFLVIEKLFKAELDLTKFILISLTLLLLAAVGLLILYFADKIKFPIQNLILKKIYSFALQINKNIKLALKIKNILQIIFISFLGQIISISFLFIVSTHLNKESISFLMFLPLSCFAFMASALPITPAGIGVGQAAFYFIFSYISLPLAGSVSTAVSLMQFFMLLTSLPGIIYFLLPSHKTI